MKNKWLYKPMATPVPEKPKKRNPMATASIIVLGLAGALLFAAGFVVGKLF